MRLGSFLCRSWVHLVWVDVCPVAVDVGEAKRFRYAISDKAGGLSGDVCELVAGFTFVADRYCPDDEENGDDCTCCDNDTEQEVSQVTDHGVFPAVPRSQRVVPQPDS